MKKFFTAAGILLSLTGIAQLQNSALGKLSEGVVVYEHIMKMEGPFRGPNGEPLDRMPKQLTERFELRFWGRQSLWQGLPDAAEGAAAVSGNNPDVMRPVRWAGGADVVYQDFERNTRITQSELGPKTFLVEDTIAKMAWKVLDETKEIAGYKAQKATAFRYGTRTIMGMENGVLKQQEQPDTSMLVAWFAPDIAVPAGPEFNNGLPGLILELDENNGRNVYRAVNVLPKVTAGSVKAPKSGKRITAAVFRQEQQKLMAEMQQRMQQGERVSIPIGN